MSLLSVILLGAALNALYIVLSTKLLRARDGFDRSLNLIGITNGISGVMLLPIAMPALEVGWLRGQTVIAIQIVLLALLMLIARALHYEALRRIDIALVAPFSAITPLITIFTGYIVLGESVGVAGMLGISVTSLGCALVYYRPLFGSRPGESSALYLGLLMALGSCIVPALAITIEKAVVLRVSPVPYTCCLLLVSAVFVGLFRICVAKTPGAPRERWALPSIGVLAMLQGGSVLLFAQALLMGVTAEVSSMKRISIVFQVVLAYYLLGQRSDMWRRVLGVIILIVGVAVLHFS